MNSIRTTIPAVMLAIALGNLLVAPSAACADGTRTPQRHFDLVNASFDSVTALAIAPAGHDAFQGIALGRPLQGGLNALTFDVPAGGCLRDLRVTFSGGRTRIFPRIDVCRSTGLRLTSWGGSAKPPRT